MSRLDRTLEPKATPVRRVEGDHRRGRPSPLVSDDDKAQIVEETLAPGAVVSMIARRLGLSPQQVFTWRRQARDREPPAVADVCGFAPVVIGAAKETREAPVIEIVIGAATVRVPPGADAVTLKAVLWALKASS